MHVHLYVCTSHTCIFHLPLGVCVANLTIITGVCCVLPECYTTSSADAVPACMSFVSAHYCYVSHTCVVCSVCEKHQVISAKFAKPRIQPRAYLSLFVCTVPQTHRRTCAYKPEWHYIDMPCRIRNQCSRANIYYSILIYILQYSDIVFYSMLRLVVCVVCLYNLYCTPYRLRLSDARK